MRPTFKILKAFQEAFWGILGGLEYWGLRPPYSVISPLESLQDSPGGLREGFHKLKCGAHPVPVSINKTNKKLPYGNLSHRLQSLIVSLQTLSMKSLASKSLKSRTGKTSKHRGIQYEIKRYCPPVSPVIPYTQLVKVGLSKVGLDRSRSGCGLVNSC